MAKYEPDSGDIIHIDLDPQAGHEEAGPHYAVVLSPKKYNVATQLAVMCPITSHIKGYPFEVTLPKSMKVHGVILADQVKNLDWVARGASFECHAPQIVMSELKAKLKVLLGLS